MACCCLAPPPPGCRRQCGPSAGQPPRRQVPRPSSLPPPAAAAAAAAAAVTSPGLNVAALLASGTQVTPQIAMAAQMAALQAKTLAETGIAVPSYYNPSSVNPVRFAEQEKKRKMLWQGKKDGVRLDFAALWQCGFSSKKKVFGLSGFGLSSSLKGTFFDFFICGCQSSALFVMLCVMFF